MHGGGQVLDVLDQIIVLGARAGDTGGIAFLERVVADQMRRHLPGQADDRNGIHQGIGQARNGVGRTGTGGNENHPDLTGRTGITFRRVHGAAFLANQDVTDVVLLENGVIQGQYRAARISEDFGDALLLQRFDHDLGALHFLPGHL